ncbi:hypothetical protein BU15DRAFT_69111, partial [Melanogaster broomeanus]
NGMGKPTGNPHGLWVQVWVRVWYGFGTGLLLQSCVSGSQTLSEAMERVKPRVSVHTHSDGYRLDYGLTNTLGGNGTGKPCGVPQSNHTRTHDIPISAVTGTGWTTGKEYNSLQPSSTAPPACGMEASGVIGYSGGDTLVAMCLDAPLPTTLSHPLSPVDAIAGLIPHPGEAEEGYEQPELP